MNTMDFNWGEELHKTIVKSVTTSFGLDFLLFDDKIGGDVNTIHNVRQEIYATEKERQHYSSSLSENPYNSHEYHRHENYIKTNKVGKAQKKNGKLKDTYTGKTFAENDRINLDHIISAKEIHDDRGRVLAGLNGADLANDTSNLTFTNESLNKSKKADSMDVFIKKLQDQQEEIKTLRNKPILTDQEQRHLKNLEKRSGADFEKMRTEDKKSRKKYNTTINQKYYTSSKFAFNISQASLTNGFKMGTRQMMGLVLAEVWLEFRDRIPAIHQKHRENFDAQKFLGDMGDTLRAVWERIRGKFHQFLSAFKDGAIGGILSTVTTTMFNIIFTTQKMMVRLIREMWSHLVQAFKIMVFNPQNLTFGELTKAVSKIVAAGIAVTAGVIINEQLMTIFAFPFGSDLATFCSALATGLLTLVMDFFLEHSAIMKKLWAFIDCFKDKFQRGLEYYKKVNIELDRYLKEISSLEFSMDTYELEYFSQRLCSVNSELEVEFILNKEIQHRNIELPFEVGNMASVKNWLNSL
ncbi:MAG: hypothetical protein ABF955_04715 [Zymomonas mobilis]